MIRLVRRYPWVTWTIVVTTLGLTLHLFGAPLPARILVSGYALLVASVEAIAMVRSIIRGHWGLDVLAVTAILATLAVGEYWASLIIVAMLTGGEALEQAAAGRAQRELRALFERVPHSAHCKKPDGRVVEVPIDEVAIGDVLIVRPGEVVPVDGLLQSRSAEFDESSLTGESLPVEKFPGELVMSGSLNGAHAVEILTSKRARDSEYQQIVALVEGAAASKAPLVRLADRYAIPFTAIAYTIAGIAWWFSGDPVRFAEVLVVATPCPLLIAAPVAFLGGMSRAAGKGIVIKDAGALERLAKVRTVAFDKTGTLTAGKPTLVEATPDKTIGLTGDDFLTLLASAEQHSTHVIAQGLREAADARNLPLFAATESSQVGTSGMLATVEGKQIVVGKPDFVASYCGEVKPVAHEPGHIVVYAAIDGQFAGTATFADTLRDDSAPALAALSALGISHTAVVSGDSAKTTRHIASELGISLAHGDLLPGDKVSIVGALEPRPVMMVGDGVNDAPVLAASDVGVALGAKGSTAASESADVVILVDNVISVARALEIGQRTIRIALQSIWLGIIISVGLMLMAALGYIPAIAGALLQEVVDLISILGALRAVREGTSVIRPRPSSR